MFNKHSGRPDKLQACCAECNREKFKKYYKNNKDKHIKKVKEVREKYRSKVDLLIKQFLQANPCIDCGNNDIRVLEFDHIGEKSFGLASVKRRGFSLKKIKEEIDKCEVRCANCHRIKTLITLNPNCYRLTTTIPSG